MQYLIKTCAGIGTMYLPLMYSSIVGAGQNYDLWMLLTLYSVLSLVVFLVSRQALSYLLVLLVAHTGIAYAGI